MKEEKDIEGLIKELKNKKFEVRIDAVKALGELKCIKGLVYALSNDMPGVRYATAEALKETDDLDGMVHAVEFFIKMLKYGKDKEKIEAITQICGHSNELFLLSTLGSNWRAEKLKKVRSKLPLELVRTALMTQVVGKNINPIVCWYALIALIELGERNNEVLSKLIDISEKLRTFCDREPDSGEDNFAILGRTFLAMSIKSETLRSLSYFKDNALATNAVISALEGQFLAGRSKGESSLHYELYALGALGDPTTRERLEYFANYGDDIIQKRAKIALECFRKFSYDEIKARAEG